MFWLGLGFISGFIYGCCKNEKEEFSTPPKAEPIKEPSDDQIKTFLQFPKVKNKVDEIIKYQTGVVNAFDPVAFYSESKNENNDKEDKPKYYDIVIEKD